MGSRAAVLLLAVLPVSLALSGCARKRHLSAATPAAPQVRAGETGLASWYGRPYHGRAAADGEIYDMEKLTAAHRTLPFGTWVRVTNLGNNRFVDVRITDRGPFVDGRIIDVSHAAAEAIGFVGAGLAQVRLDILSPPDHPVGADWFTVQAGAFADQDRAERLRRSLEPEFGAARLILRPGNPSLWRVLVGREPTEQAANLLGQRVRKHAGTAFVVRLDQSATLAASPDPVTSRQ